jgi:ribulose-phosphate 3-epimerase
MKEQLMEVKRAGAEYIHYDVMDGIFVLNTAFGPEWLTLIHDCGLKANVHMMVQDPLNWIEHFIKYPVNSLTFHPEVTDKRTATKAFDILKKHHIKFGIAIKATVDAHNLTDYLSICDYVCIMSVEPGKGGQAFIPNAIDNLKKVKHIKDTINPNLTIQLDGGVNLEVIKQTAE